MALSAETSRQQPMVKDKLRPVAHNYRVLSSDEEHVSSEEQLISKEQLGNEDQFGSEEDVIGITVCSSDKGVMLVYS
ncbi:hypothetical protein PF003_g6337 [Phytophthora fragariae]|nr:hypothetical protein PF003_g6337 [Phytophthora fragariae]